jgi:hypothetical protein
MNALDEYLELPQHYGDLLIGFICLNDIPVGYVEDVYQSDSFGNLERKFQRTL